MTRCLLCGREHEPGQHDFSGLGDAVMAHAARQFDSVFEGDVRPIPAVQQVAQEMTKTRRNGVLPEDDPEPLPASVNVQQGPYRAPMEAPVPVFPKRRGRPPKVKRG